MASRNEQPISLDRLIRETAVVPSRPQPEDPRLTLDPDEVPRRFRRVWLRQLLLGPVLVILYLGFLLARSYWGGVLYKVPWIAFVIGFLALELGFAFVNNRCPSCRSRLRGRRTLSLDYCPKCGAAFTAPVPENAPIRPGGSRQPLTGAQRGNLAIAAGLVSFAIVALSPTVVSATEASPRLPMASPTLLQASQPASGAPLKATRFAGGQFTFQYVATWKTSAMSSTTVNGSKILDEIGLFDPDAVTESGDYTDYMDIVAMKLTYVVDENTSYPHLQRQLEQDWAKAYGKVELVEPWQNVSSAGLNGFRGTFTYTSGGLAVVKSETFLFRGNIQYELIAHATLASWVKDGPAFQTVYSSFLPGSLN